MSDLFGNTAGVDAYGDALKPLSHADDPVTSHEAAARHKRSGKLQAHADIALALVKRFPGCTRAEIWRHATAEEAIALGDQTELQRRLSGLCSEGKIKQGPARKCAVKSSKMVTWEPM